MTYCGFQIRQLPECVIVETTEYKCLQSQFSVLYNESMQLKTLLDDARQQLQNSKNAHLRQIEQMEVSFPPTFIWEKFSTCSFTVGRIGCTEKASDRVDSA
jgi:hypothetical protein